MRFLCVLMAVAIICFLGQEAESSEEVDFPHGSISGVVTGSQNGKPVVGAKVEVTKNGFSFGILTKTDRNGKYILENVPVGIFDVTVLKTNFMKEVISDVNIEDGKDTASVNILMQMITPIKAGEEARDFSLSTLDGKMFRLSAFKGKSIVLLGIGDPYG